MTGVLTEVAGRFICFVLFCFPLGSPVAFWSTDSDSAAMCLSFVVPSRRLTPLCPLRRRRQEDASAARISGRVWRTGSCSASEF